MSGTPPLRNWACTGTIIGIILAIGGFPLGISSKMTQDGPVMVPHIKGGVEYIIFITVVPIAYAAGISARKNPQVLGDEGLRLQ
ncbi:hypothetical protein ACFLVX_04040 [Chloroflexota bacterium]